MALVVSAAACSATGPGTEKTAQTGGPLVLGHSYQNITDEFFATELQTERQSAKAKGWQFISTDAQSNPARQLDDINTLISRGVDVLVVDPIDPDAVVPGITAAQQAGIPVLSLIRKPSRGKIDGLIYLDSVRDGRNGCDYIAKQLHGKGTVVNITGPMQIQAARERAEGCNQALKRYPGIKVVAQPSTDYTLRDGQQKMTDVLQAHPDVDAVFGGNDQVALGAVRALIAAGQNPKDKVVVGIDGTQSGLQAVCDGTMKMSLATFSNKEARLVIDAAEKLRAGKKVGRVLFPAEPVTAGNVTAQAKVAGYQLKSCKADAS
ncbi:sugar ABC transporter substrate-binding protein [Streptomyces ferrugineus]|uniref:Sugar ABC transporter substrate-binding protein n=2 Tax=Streptomyces ferrugineus TaxID=1413221 RepID=A0A7M2SXY6_9ACTN|nr:sugar ABC transporter substrate-binding protein [Streptomyces ferrugineus]